MHEEPFDFYRYTPYALSHLLEQAGFAEVSVEHRAGFLVTLAQMAEMTRWIYSASGRPRKSQTPPPAPAKRLALVLVRACAEGIRWAVRRDPSLTARQPGSIFPSATRRWRSSRIETLRRRASRGRWSARPFDRRPEAA